MNYVYGQARKLRRDQVREIAVQDAKGILSDERLHPSVKVALAAERLAQAYKTLEALQDG